MGTCFLKEKIKTLHEVKKSTVCFEDNDASLDQGEYVVEEQLGCCSVYKGQGGNNTLLWR